MAILRPPVTLVLFLLVAVYLDPFKNKPVDHVSGKDASRITMKRSRRVIQPQIVAFLFFLAPVVNPVCEAEHVWFRGCQEIDNCLTMLVILEGGPWKALLLPEVWVKAACADRRTSTSWFSQIIDQRTSETAPQMVANNPGKGLSHIGFLQKTK